MRRNISLYINGVQADLETDSFILFNYTKDDLENPTIVKNSFSQQITLPGTPTNNRIFDHIGKADKVTYSGGYNPLVKTPFVIYSGADILEKGYIKLNKVNKTDGGVLSYDVNLYGGLGGFFYNLMYNEDGTKKTLADLYYNKPTGGRGKAKDISFSFNRNSVSNAWKTLEGVYNFPLYKWFNFAPCYNGIPKGKFSADKAIYKPGAGTAIYPNLYTSKDGYSAKVGSSNSILLELEKAHTEWEVQDLRSYLQRPIIKMSELLEALTYSDNTGDYTFIIDPVIKHEYNYWYQLSWMTLPMFDRDKNNPSSVTLATLLSETKTPADYLISFAKVFGLCFVFDATTNTITMMMRNTFYDGQTIDLEGRVQKGGTLTPYAMTAKNYVWKYPQVFGEFAEEYKLKYGKEYGSQYVNTGYEFYSQLVDTLKDCAFNGANDAEETSLDFHYYGGNTSETGTYTNNLFKFALTESVKWSLYKTEDGQEKTQPFSPSLGWLAPFAYNGNSSSYKDFFPKVQLHSADNQAQSGENVLVFFNGMVSTPSKPLADAIFHLSDDSSAMDLLNGGQPCWDVSVTGTNILNVTLLPSFRRWYVEEGDLMATMDFGDPQEIAVDGEYDLGMGIYRNFWYFLISDKYDVDARVVTKKVDFSGIVVGAELLRHFYTFDGCIWVLNKIINHSLTTWDLVECEFIKVKDIDSYILGQIEF